MKKLLILLGLMTAVTVTLLPFSTELWRRSFSTHTSPEYEWKQLAPPGSGTHQHEWKPGTYPSAVVPIKALNGDLWMIGQKRAWSSKDGIKWQAFEKNDWGERISTKIVFFKGTFLVTGGMEYAANQFLNEIWTSTDGTRWKKSVEHAEWSPRKGHTLVEFGNNLWLFGGETSVDEHKAPAEFINDIWRSEDGKSWVKVMDESPWEVRGNPRVTVFLDKLWLIGGQGLSDIWNSSDGKVWSKVIDECPWGNRYDYGVLVFNNRLWILGGRQANPRNAFQDVWSSADGITWRLHTARAPWTPRSGNFSIAFKNELLLYGGKHTGHADSFSGDIWAMQRIIQEGPH